MTTNNLTLESILENKNNPYVIFQSSLNLLTFEDGDRILFKPINKQIKTTCFLNNEEDDTYCLWLNQIQLKQEIINTANTVTLFLNEQKIITWESTDIKDSIVNWSLKEREYKSIEAILSKNKNIKASYNDFYSWASLTFENGDIIWFKFKQPVTQNIIKGQYFYGIVHTLEIKELKTEDSFETSLFINGEEHTIWDSTNDKLYWVYEKSIH